jgi:hypothetical protein
MNTTKGSRVFKNKTTRTSKEQLIAQKIKRASDYVMEKNNKLYKDLENC